MLNTGSRPGGSAARVAPQPNGQAGTEDAGRERHVVYRRESGPARLRAWAARDKAPAVAPPPGGALIAELSDGPLEGCTREVSAVEGRPPKTIDIVSGDRTMRYCLAAWEQSGHTAVYGFLYDV